ncbi:MAG: sulfurtransferase [Legionella sp. 40-6]|nr:rhodanese-like domain-containing protein [Legionella sp.]OJY57516.1 MAG: sulfurtransferase [Legionella sp. 40-6]
MEHLSQFIINHWQLWLLFIVILTLVFINELLMKKKKAKELSPQAVVDLMNNNEVIIIDLRDKELYKKSHILNSINAKADDFAQQKMDKYKDKPLVLVCDRGLQASTLANKIREQGFDPVVLSGGLNAWVSADLPLVKGK